MTPNIDTVFQNHYILLSFGDHSPTNWLNERQARQNVAEILPSIHPSLAKPLIYNILSILKTTWAATKRRQFDKKDYFHTSFLLLKFP